MFVMFCCASKRADVNSDTNQRIPDTSIVQDSSQSKTSSELGGIDSKDKFGNLASGLEHLRFPSNCASFSENLATSNNNPDCLADVIC
jgi:hypothetical protein